MMRLLTEIRERLRAILFRAEEERQTAEELEFHADMEAESHIRRGAEPGEARRRARWKLGGATQVHEQVRAARGVRWLEILVQDLRYGVRGIRLNPLFAAALVLTLGLGIGANAAMFGVVDALLLRPLPYGEPDRLVQVWSRNPATGGVSPLVGRDFARPWMEPGSLFEATFLHSRRNVLYTGAAEPVTLAVQAVSPSFEETLRVHPMIGRGLEASDALAGAEPVALLSHSFWRSAFGGDPGAIGRPIDLDGERHRIVGVMAADFKFPEYSHTEVWVPLAEERTAQARTGRIALLGRLRGTEPVEVAQARADALAAGLAEARPRDGGWNVLLRSFAADRGGNPDLRRSVWFLSGAVALILLVATLNGVNLLLVRGWSRTRELAVRLALGASRRRLVSQLLTESSILALVSGAAAVLFALAILRSIQGILPGSITFFAPYAFEVEERTLAFTFAVATVAGLVIGLVPAVLATRLGAAAAEGALTAYAARTPVRSRLRRVLVVSEVALSVTLLVGAGLMIHSFVRLVRVDPGFRLDDVAIVKLSLSRSGYPTGEARMAFLRRVEERFEAVPGVVGATTGGGGMPAGSLIFTDAIETEHRPVESDGGPSIILGATVSPDFFALFEVRVLVGRALTEADLGTDNAIIDVDLARRIWGDGNPIGGRFRPEAGWPWQTVVGVVGDLKLEGPDDRGADFEMLTPASNTASGYASVAFRTAGDPRPLFPAIRAAIHELDPNQPISQLETARSIYAETIDLPRFLLVLMATLSGLALVLAVIGVYGVLAFGVAQRRFDLGVRIALGARPAALSLRVLGEGLALAGIGAVLGVAGALALSGLIRGLLFGVEPGDPATIAAVVVVSLLAAASASLLPALRTTRIDPVEVLKSD